MGHEKRQAVDHQRLDDLRRGQGPVQEHVVDELLGGRLTRRQFLRAGTVLGMSLPVLGKILEASGRPGVAYGPMTASRAAKAGATIRAGSTVPAAAINPITIADQGGLELIGNVGEFLVFTDQHNNYHPWLATGWSMSPDAKVWTFKIRQGVRFNDGRPMTVDDVVYSFKSQSDPKSSANALSVFAGTLTPSGVEKVDGTTVAFHLETPDVSFVDAVSQDNYNLVVVPKGYDYAHYQKQWPGTGRFMVESYTPGQGAVFVRNPHYWGKKAVPARVEWTFYPEEAPKVAALEAGQVDCIDEFSVTTSPQLLNGGFNVISVKAATHRECSMRNDVGPFKSKYVRQAIALALNRPEIVSALFKGYAQIGNDSPFAPVFKSTVGPPAVPQRVQNLRLARELLGKGGYPRGFSTPLLTETTQEMPHFAEIIKASAAKIGVDVTLTIETPTKYYGQGVFGKSDWLDGEMSLVDYGARAVPNLYLEAPLQTANAKTGQGAWNAARFNDPTYDKLSKEFVAAVDLASQRRLATRIERLLLDETPVVYAYFFDWLSATAKRVTGVYPTAQGQFFLWNAAET